MKQAALKDQPAGRPREADRVFCYSAGLGWDAAAALAALGAKASAGDDFDALLDQIAGTVRAGDHVLIMSNGSFGGIHGKLLARLAGNAPHERST